MKDKSIERQRYDNFSTSYNEIKCFLLDEAKIAEARRNAEQALANQSANIDTTAALTALAESLAQLQTIQKYKNRA